MDKIIKIEELEKNIFYYLGKRFILCGEYLPHIDGWKSCGGIVGNKIDIPFSVNGEMELPSSKTQIICEGLLKIANEKIEKPLAISIKCNFKSSHYVTDPTLIDSILKKENDDKMDSGFEKILQKFSERKRPKILLLHPSSETSKEDTIKSMAEYANKYLIDNRVLQYIRYTDEDISEEKEYIRDLKKYDKECYDAICFISGGRGDEGSAYGLLHHEQVIKTISELKTPTIGAIGHSNETHIFDFAFNRTISTPSLLGVELAAYAKTSVPAYIPVKGIPAPNPK